MNTNEPKKITAPAPAIAAPAIAASNKFTVILTPEQLEQALKAKNAFVAKTAVVAKTVTNVKGHGTDLRMWIADQLREDGFLLASFFVLVSEQKKCYFKHGFCVYDYTQSIDIAISLYFAVALTQNEINWMKSKVPHYVGQIATYYKANPEQFKITIDQMYRNPAIDPEVSTKPAI